jgi:hypothetical protein
VREHAAECRPVRALGEEVGQRVVQRELARVAQLEDADGRKGLRDRADPVLRLGRGDTLLLDVGEAGSVLPEDLAAPEDRGRDRRQTLLGLGFAQPTRELVAQLRPGHELRAPVGSPRSHA